VFYASKGLERIIVAVYVIRMLSDLSQKVGNKFECKTCNYICSNKHDFTKHCLTIKHNAILSGDNAIPKLFTCQCGSTYKHRPSYYRHKKNCSKPDTEQPTKHIDMDKPTHMTDNVPQFDAALVIELLKQNQEFKALMLEQSKQLAEQQNQMAEQQLQLLEAVKDGKIGNTNTNCHNTTNSNNKFNLNVFLNETCKDAISMDDFINSIEVTRDEFIHTGQVGFVEGISTVMAHRFRDMEMHTRPLHCTDLKRETIYIKNADKWEKDDADKTKMRKAVRGVAKKNMKELWRWYTDNKPAVEQIGTDVCEDYFQYHKAALGGYGKEEDLKFEEKIIKNVLKEVHVDKSSALTM
jgi:hypothetical protein